MELLSTFKLISGLNEMLDYFKKISLLISLLESFVIDLYYIYIEELRVRMQKYRS